MSNYRGFKLVAILEKGSFLTKHEQLLRLRIDSHRSAPAPARRFNEKIEDKLLSVNQNCPSE